MPRRICIPLLAAATVAAADPGFRDFPAFVKARGLKATIRPMQDFEKEVDKLRTALEREHKTYLRYAEKWWDWRRDHERDYYRRHKRPPVEYPVPQGLNRAYIDQEVVFGSARSNKLNEEMFQDSVFRYIRGEVANQAAAGGTDGDVLAALGRGLRSKNIHQRLRCVRILRHAGEKARPLLEKAAKSEKHPVVLGEILRAHRGQEFLVPYLAHTSWPVRSGAILGLGDKVPATHEEKGRLRDELAWARGQPAESAVEILGAPTSSHAILFLFDASSENVWAALADHAVAAVQSLPDQARFAIVLQGGKPAAFKKGAKAAAVRWLRKHKVRPGADLAAAFRVAMELAGNGKRVSTFDTLFVVQPAPPFKPALDLYRQRYVRPREVAMEVKPLNDVRGLRVFGIGKSGGGNAYYLEMLAEPFLGLPRRK